MWPQEFANVKKVCRLKLFNLSDIMFICLVGVCNALLDAPVFHPSVGGGELFDRIIDENYTLMELDAVTFIRQICDGLQHMHKMYILHLDLKVGSLSSPLLFFSLFRKLKTGKWLFFLLFLVNFSQKTFFAWAESRIRSKSSTLVWLGCKYSYVALRHSQL